MQIDDAIPTAEAGGKNEGFFRIGRHLEPNGAVEDWGPDWLGVPHWFSWTNQGGAITTAEIDGVNRLITIMVDAPAGQNSGHYRLLDLDQDPAVYGSWQVKSFFSQVLPVHAALLPGGDVLFFAGSGSSQKRFASPLFGKVAGRGRAERRLEPTRRHLLRAPDADRRRPPPLRPVLRRRHVPGRRAHALRRWHQGLRPLPRPGRRRRLRPGHADVVLHRPDGARPLVPDAHHARLREGAGHHRPRRARCGRFEERPGDLRPGPAEVAAPRAHRRRAGPPAVRAPVPDGRRTGLLLRRPDGRRPGDRPVHPRPHPRSGAGPARGEPVRRRAAQPVRQRAAGPRPGPARDDHRRRPGGQAGQDARHRPHQRRRPDRGRPGLHRGTAAGPRAACTSTPCCCPTGRSSSAAAR